MKFDEDGEAFFTNASVSFEGLPIDEYEEETQNDQITIKKTENDGIIDEEPELNMPSMLDNNSTNQNFSKNLDITNKKPKKGAFLLDREINYISR